MEAYKRGSHTVWDCKYHLVWITNYRHPVVAGDVGIRYRELLRETARGVMVCESAEWRTDPALSRTLKPPPFRRWSVHIVRIRYRHRAGQRNRRALGEGNARRHPRQ